MYHYKMDKMLENCKKIENSTEGKIVTNDPFAGRITPNTEHGLAEFKKYEDSQFRPKLF